MLGGAIILTALGVAFGWQAPAIAIAAAVLPALGFLLVGHAPGRAAAAGCLAIGLAGTLIRPVSGAIHSGDLTLLAGMAVVACFGASQARKLSAAGGPAVTPEGRWVSIIIDCENPSDSAGQAARPKVSPHPSPERRGLTRLAGDRRRGRRPALVR